MSIVPNRAWSREETRSAATCGEIDGLVLSNDSVAGEYRRLTLSLPETMPRAVPGQFYQLLCPGTGSQGAFLRRPMSVYRVEEEPHRVSFLYKVAGIGTTAMAGLEKGDVFNVFGPLGVGFSLPPAAAPIVILARGVGLATMAPLVRFARNNGHRVTAVLSARSPDLLMSVDEMRRDGATVLTVTDTDGTSDIVNVAAILEACHAQGEMGALYVCGSNRLMQAAQEVARRHGLYGEAALEQQMACGLGMCFCCVRPFREGASIVHRRVCSEGPVFPLADAIAW